MIRYQQTIKNEFSLAGVGIHLGKHATITFKPAPPNHWIKFKRTDVNAEVLINADVDNVVDVSRGTTLEKNGVRLHTVEHVLAALIGLEIDNVLIEIDGPEVPILDGSSLIFIEALQQAGIERQKVERFYADFDTNVIYRDDANDVELMAIPGYDYQLTVMIDFDSPVIGTQHATLDSISDFPDKIASARTFCFLHELEYLMDKNLIKGGDLSNAVVVVDRELNEQQIQRLSSQFNIGNDVAVVSPGILNNVELRYQNEPARHKLLDLVGDLALVGAPIRAKIVARKPGHASNIEFARKLKDYISKNKQKVVVPKYDPTAEPVYDIRKIEKSLPHKYPFLLVDKIIELSASHVIGIKNVTFNEYFFQGHFPGNPVMPGVLQIEALAQAGGVLVLNTVEDPENYDTYFLMIDKVRFKNKVVPGDTLILKLELMSPIRRGICEMKGTAFVGNKIATEAELVAKIFRKES